MSRETLELLKEGLREILRGLDRSVGSGTEGRVDLGSSVDHVGEHRLGGLHPGSDLLHDDQPDCSRRLKKDSPHHILPWPA